jgi:hypothetical protein
MVDSDGCGGNESETARAAEWVLCTNRKAPSFVIDASTGHPVVVVMMPAAFGGGQYRVGFGGLGTSSNAPAQLAFGEVWTSGSALEWSVGTSVESGCSGEWWLQASSTGDDVEIVARGGASGPDIQRGTARLVGAGFRKVELSLWASGRGLVVAPAAAWYVVNEGD